MAYPDELPSSAKRLYVPGKRPGFRYSEDGFECWDTYSFDYADFKPALTIIGGTVESIGGVLDRIVPLRNADFLNAIAYDAQVDEEGWNTSANTPAKVFIKVMYRLPRWATNGSEAFLSFATSGGVRTLQAPVGAATAGSGAFAHAIGNQVPTTVYTVTSHNLATLSASTYSPYKGYVNSDTWRGFDPNTVMFRDVSSSQSQAVNGQSTFDLSFVFEHCRIAWTQEYNSAGTLTTFTVGGSAQPPSTSFISLFGW
jgi:hypothetical protein